MHFHPSWTVIFVFIAFVSERIVGGDSNPNKQEEESPDLKTYRIKARVGRHFKTVCLAFFCVI
jgi:hypothetical protein